MEAMRFQEYGTKQKNVILLLHGGGLSWWNYREAAKLLQGEYHVILPILDGHSGSDRPFTTIEDNASEIISFMYEHLNGSALLIGGLSLRPMNPSRHSNAARSKPELSLAERNERLCCNLRDF